MPERVGTESATGLACSTACTLAGRRKKGASRGGVLDYLDGEEAGVKSVTIQINGGEYLRLSEVGKRRSPSGAHFSVQCGGQEGEPLCIL